ncbi:MAG: hypothetical protein ABIR34_13080, partial [Marmoricola sp.]
THHESRAQRAESGFAEAQVRIQSLELALARRQVDGSEALVDLVAWDEQTGQQTAAKESRKRPGLKLA